MTKRDKLKKILQILDPTKGTAVDFKQFDEAVSKLKSGLEEKVQAQTLDDVNSQLDKFKKKIDFSPLLEAMANLETSLDLKIKGVTGLLSNEVSTLKKLQASQEESAKEQVSTVASNIEVLRTELTFLNDQKSIDLADLKTKVGKLDEFSKSVKESYAVIQGQIIELRQELKNEDVEEVKNLTDKLEKLRRELNNRISNLGGGAMNRQMYIGGVDPLKRYTDTNFKAGSNVTISYANNDTTKQVDITFAATGGAGTVRSISTVSVSSVIGTLAGTDQVILANAGIQITLPTAVSDTNLYTIKNVGVSSVLIGTTGGQTIDGSTTLIMPVQYTSVDIVSDNTNWNLT